MSFFSSDNSHLQQLFDLSREADLAGETHKIRKSAKTSCGNVFARTNRPLEIPPSPSSRGYPWKIAKLYESLSKGDVKSFVLKEKGAIRGIRLIDRDSLDAYLDAKAAQAQEA
jgi:hypothetical protein